MMYQKPEVAVLGVATAAIRGSNKGTTQVTDMSLEHTTTNAYEADE